MNKSKTKKAPKVVKKTLNDISKWNSVQTELQCAAPTDEATSKKQFRCRLCKRQFKSDEHLERHKDLSDLHKSNLSKSGNAMEENSTKMYRDRARCLTLYIYIYE